jgi:outer membrane receptor protein involved in Fe transport
MTKRLLLLLVSLGFFSFVEAQEASDASSDVVVETENDEDEAEPEEVVVTGSRIARTQYEVAQPVTIIYGEEYENRGYTNAADALFDVPGIGVTNSLTSGSGGSFGNQSSLSVGQALANNFGLGSGRTLVLVNGRRFVGSTSPFGSGGSGNAVDINNIPSVMIDRVEIVNAGGSAVYGSDAIAGVINYVLKDDYEGAAMTLVYDDYAGLSSDVSFQAVMGGNFAGGKGNMVMNFQYEEIGTVFTGDWDRYYDKENGVCETNSLVRTYAAGKAYQQQYIRRGMVVPYTANVEGNPQVTQTGCIGLSAIPETGRATLYDYSFKNGANGIWYFDGQWPDGTSWHFGDVGDLQPYYDGINYGSSFFGFDAMDAYRSDFNTLRAGFERLNFSMFSNYDVNDNMTVYFDVFHNGFFSFDYGNTSGYPYSTWAFGSGQDFPPTIGIDNPFLTQNSVDIMNSYGATEVYVHKSHIDLLQKGDGGYTVENNNSVSMYSVGVEGNFDLNDQTFNYAAGYSIGNTEIYSDAPGVIGARYAAALDVGINPNTGEVDCRMNYDPARDPALYDYSPFAPGFFTGGTLFGPSLLGSVGDCAPLNILGRGAPSQAARDYIGTNLRTNAFIEQEVTYGVLSGDLFDLPGGTVKAAMGFEARVEQGDYNSSAIQNLELTRSAARPSLGGGYEVDADYYEISVPLLGEDLTLPGVMSLVADYSARTIDNSIAGSYDVDATSLNWRIMDDLAIRYSEQTAVKAPDLGDLFLPQITAFSRADDPCDYRFRDVGRNPDQRRANCDAEGIPADFVSLVVNATARGVTGGNPNLINEVADTVSTGIVYQPNWWGDVFFGSLNLAADYIEIELTDYVTSFSLSQNMAACYDYDTYPTSQFCDSFTRDADFEVVDFATGLINAGLIDFATYVYKADFAFDVAELASFVSRENVAMDLGSMAVRWRATQEDFFASADSGAAEDLSSATGQFGNDEWFYDTAVEWVYGDWYVWVQGNSRSGGVIDINRQYDDEYLGYDGNPIYEFDGYTTYNGGVGYYVNDDTTLRVNFYNLMDYDGFEEDVFTPEADLLFIGRQVNASLNVRF